MQNRNNYGIVVLRMTNPLPGNILCWIIYIERYLNNKGKDIISLIFLHPFLLDPSLHN
jgi:hypothetical protein